jgi:hypothetical protein
MEIAAFAHRRKIVAGTTVAGAGLLGLSLSTKPASWEFYALTLSVAGTGRRRRRLRTAAPRLDAGT